ncbi:hypothetical protein PanWU01x14_314570 [Parasponia andersonii]|uniref:Uncharacterized protein n=1 Tax=Parasponia andersonii TaxID=3476 RepID=A0A2P5ANN9_PARAD|nr:hypothetical protein PanWU01x14_314570 [Parasponia andersonii]
MENGFKTFNSQIERLRKREKERKEQFLPPPPVTARRRCRAHGPARIKELPLMKPKPLVLPCYTVGRRRSCSAKILFLVRLSDEIFGVRPPFLTPPVSGVSSHCRRPPSNGRTY